MYRDKKILAIIPARGGSKGLPGKNIKPLLGKPLIGWSIEQAQASKYIDEIFVSTDSREIGQVACTFGIEVSDYRPEELAVDTAPSSAFILYTLNLYQTKGIFFDYFILLEPTSPLRTVEDIDGSIEILVNHPIAESIVGVCKVGCAHPAFLVKMGENGILNPYLKEMGVLRRQETEDLYFFEGSTYVSKVCSYVKYKSFYHDKTLPYIIPKSRAFEIDDAEDWNIIESILKNK